MPPASDNANEDDAFAFMKKRRLRPRSKPALQGMKDLNEDQKNTICDIAEEIMRLKDPQALAITEMQFSKFVDRIFEDWDSKKLPPVTVPVTGLLFQSRTKIGTYLQEKGPPGRRSHILGTAFWEAAIEDNPPALMFKVTDFDGEDVDMKNVRFTEDREKATRSAIKNLLASQQQKIATTDHWNICLVIHEARWVIYSGGRVAQFPRRTIAADQEPEEGTRKRKRHTVDSKLEYLGYESPPYLLQVLKTTLNISQNKVDDMCSHEIDFSVA